VGLGCLALLAIGLLALGAAYVIVPPLAHGLLISAWRHWIGWALLGAALSGVVMALLGLRVSGIAVAAVFGVVWVISGMAGDVLRKEAFLAASNVAYLDSQPDTTGFRYLPMEVAGTIATNRNTDTQANPGEAEPYVKGDEANWLVPLEPNNGSATYFGGQPGYLLIDTASDTTHDQTVYDPAPSLCCFWRSWSWRNVTERFWADYSPRPYMTELEGEAVWVQPYLTYSLDWHTNILPVMVPGFGGVLVRHADGTSDDLSPQEAASRYAGERLYPEELSGYFADAYQYKDGWWNAVWRKKDLPDVPKLSDENQFPYLIPTENGPAWYTAVEPHGSSTSAYMSYYIDATIGQTSVYRFDGYPSGPDTARAAVNQAYNNLKGTSFYEPRPLMQGENLYWMYSAWAGKTPDIEFTALVDAYTNDVIRLDTKRQVERVVAGEDPRKVGSVVSASSSGESTSTEEATLSDAELVQALRQAADRLEKAGKGG